MKCSFKVRQELELFPDSLQRATWPERLMDTLQQDQASCSVMSGGWRAAYYGQRQLCFTNGKILWNLRSVWQNSFHGCWLHNLMPIYSTNLLIYYIYILWIVYTNDIFIWKVFSTITSHVSTLSNVPPVPWCHVFTSLSLCWEALESCQMLWANRFPIYILGAWGFQNSCCCCWFDSKSSPHIFIFFLSSFMYNIHMVTI